MTYRIDPNPTFWATVKVRRPGDEPSQDSFRAKFKALTVSAFNAHDLSDDQGTRSFVTDVLLEIGDVEAEDGSSLKLTGAVLDRLLDAANVRAGLVRAYVAAFREELSGN